MLGMRVALVLAAVILVVSATEEISGGDVDIQGALADIMGEERVPKTMSAVSKENDDLGEVERILTLRSLPVLLQGGSVNTDEDAAAKTANEMASADNNDDDDDGGDLGEV